MEKLKIEKSKFVYQIMIGEKEYLLSVRNTSLTFPKSMEKYFLIENEIKNLINRYQKSISYHKEKEEISVNKSRKRYHAKFRKRHELALSEIIQKYDTFHETVYMNYFIKKLSILNKKQYEQDEKATVNRDLLIISES